MDSGLYLPPGMAHVSRKDLYCSFQARLKYLHSFIEFGQDDIDILKQAQPFIKSLIPKVAELVYNKLLENDITAQALVNQTTKEDNNLDADDFFDQKSANVKHRHLFVRWYLTKLNSDPNSPSYWEYMNKVGAMHHSHLRRQPLTVDVIHYSLMVGHVQNVLNEAIILSNVGFDPQQKVALVKAWGKLLWIQNDLFVKWHIKDGEEYDQMSPGALKVLHDEAMGQDSVMTDDSGRKIGCPFSSMAKLSLTEKDGESRNGYVYKSRPGISMTAVGSSSESGRSSSFRSHAS